MLQTHSNMVSPVLSGTEITSQLICVLLQYMRFTYTESNAANVHLLPVVTLL